MGRIDPKDIHVAKIWPPYDVPGGDRQAHYTHKGRFYDVLGREIVPGKPLEETARQEQQNAGR